MRPPPLKVLMRIASPVYVYVCVCVCVCIHTKIQTRRCLYYVRTNIMCQRRPTMCQKRPTMCQKRPTMCALTSRPQCTDITSSVCARIGRRRTQIHTHTHTHQNEGGSGLILEDRRLVKIHLACVFICVNT
jgi:hypothetical protein